MTWWQWCLFAYGIIVIVAWWQMFYRDLPRDKTSGHIDWLVLLGVAIIVLLIAPYSVYMVERTKRERRLWAKAYEKMTRIPSTDACEEESRKTK